MKTFKILYFTVITLLLISCEDVLDKEPVQDIPSELALSSEDNITNILIGTYATAGDEDLFGGQTHIIADLLGNTDQVSWDGTFIAPEEFVDKQILVNNNFVSAHWRTSYEVINQANLVLDHLDIITSSTDKKNRIEGEAKFLRALSYFDLIRFYSLPYRSGEVNSQLGVPLRLIGLIDFNTDVSIARSTVEQIYAQIINDLIEAYDVLPDTNGFFADKYAAQALLARVYLQQGNYAAARDAADDVLTNSGHSLTNTFEEAFNNDEDGDEDIFTFQVTSQTGSNALITFYASEDNGGRGTDITIEDGYLDLFDDPDNDVRASFFYEEDGSDLTSKYTNQFGNVPTLRIAEMHLIRAEANFREGTSVGLAPLDEINMLRDRSETSELDNLTLDLILNERQLELGFEGHLLHDLKRTARSVGDIPYNDNSIVLPIPLSEMDTNNLMKQNPGYGN